MSKKENCLEYQFLRLTKLINKNINYIYKKHMCARQHVKKIRYIYIKNYEMYQKSQIS